MELVEVEIGINQDLQKMDEKYSSKNRKKQRNKKGAPSNRNRKKPHQKFKERGENPTQKQQSNKAQTPKGQGHQKPKADVKEGQSKGTAKPKRRNKRRFRNNKKSND